MEQQLLYRLWLNECCDHNPKQINRLLRELGPAEEIYKLDLNKPAYSEYLRLGQRLRISKNLDALAKKLEHWQEKGIRVLSIDDAAYPERLRELYDPPQLLYVLGEAPDFNKMLGVAVVGARRSTDDGKKFAREMAKDLAKSGGVIVSGLAVGADSAALWGALEAGGITVAVLAGGVDKVYPKENKDLYQHILNHGCILSEQPPGTTGKPYFYEQRNRIMAGIAQGVVVVEGECKSGTAITARLAQEVNADIFAVPGNPLNPYSALPNALIRDGCIPMTGALDLVEEYLDRYPEKLEYGIGQLGKPLVGIKKGEKPAAKPKEPPMDWRISKEEPEKEKAKSTEKTFEEWLSEKKFSAEERTILQCLREKGDQVPFDDLADACGMETGLLSSQLIILQMKKAVSQSAGGRYSLSQGE